MGPLRPVAVQLVKFHTCDDTGATFAVASNVIKIKIRCGGDANTDVGVVAKGSRLGESCFNALKFVDIVGTCTGTAADEQGADSAQALLLRMTWGPGMQTQRFACQCLEAKVCCNWQR